MAHDHSHGHRHYDRAFALSIVLNLAFVVGESIYGLIAHSMSLVADAGHNLSDVLGLALAWGAGWLARRKPSKYRTYGFRRVTILAALANGVLIFLVTGGVAWESLRRLSSPGVVAGKTVMVVAAVGVAVNGISALFLRKGREHDLNVRGAFLHLLVDAAVSVGVVVTGVVIFYTGWNLADPIVSLALSLVIVVTSWGLLRSSVYLALDAVPEGIDPDEVRTYLQGLPDVLEVHDLHIWAMSTTETALTAHLRMKVAERDPHFLGSVCKVLHDRFSIEHATLQLETPGAEPCGLAVEGSV